MRPPSPKALFTLIQATFVTLFDVSQSRSADMTSSSFCGVLKTHFRLATGCTMPAFAAAEMSGACACWTVSTIASVVPLWLEPMMTETLSSWMRRFATRTVWLS